MNELVEIARSVVEQKAQAITYLQGSGWDLVRTVSGDSLWTKGVNGDRQEIIFPVASEKLDAARHVAEALQTLAALENRTVRAVFADIMQSQKDVIRIRTESQAPSGSAPLDDALSLMQSSRDLLEAAASTVDRPRHVLGPRKPFAATDFAKSAEASTESGSFVLALAVPVANETGGPSAELAEYLDGALFDPRVPYARRVNEQLMQAVARVVELGHGVEQGFNDISDFDSVVGLGVSANLLESLVKLGTVEYPTETLTRRRRDFSISIRWALGRRATVSTPATVRITRDAISVFEEVATSFRSRQPQPDTEIIGELVGNVDDPNDGSGTATIRTTIAVSSVERPKRRTVRVPLNAADYELALRAHAGRHDVRAVGDLQVSGRLQLDSVTRFEILDDPENED